MKRIAAVLLAVFLCIVVVTATHVRVSSAGKPKNFLPTPTPALLPAPQADAAASPTDGVYYVSPGGSDSSGNGSLESPWRTASYALDHGPSRGGFTVVLLDGDYPDQVTTHRSFVEPVQVRAMHDYQAVLVNTGRTPIKLGGSSDAHKSFNITFSGLEIKGLGSGSQGYALVYLWKADDVTLDNCIIHDSYNNDLLRVLHSARITVKDSVFYNPQAGEEAIDINGGSQDVVVADSIFFNDYAASGRSESPARPLILVKTSGLDSDGITRRITLERNIFLHKDTGTVWPSMVCLGSDNKPHYEAQEVTIQNNLFAASDGRAVGKAVRVAGSRDVLIRANTIRSAAGSFQAMGRVEKMSSNPRPANIQFANNVFLDETGYTERLIRGGPGDMESGSLHNNLYWFAGRPPLVRADDLLNYTADDRAMVADPLLPPGGDLIPMPVWQGRVFAGGYGSIPGAFAAYVQRYAVPAAGSPIIDAASANMPSDDITGSPRQGAPDVGAYEVSGSEVPVPSPNPSQMPASMPTDIPVLPTDPLTNTPVPPTDPPTNTPVPPMATPTNTPVPSTSTPTNTPVPPPTNTPVPSPTNTPVPPPTNTPGPPTDQPADASALPTAMPTLTTANVLALPEGEVYYVSPGGSDSSGNGSLENPWQTVAYALDNGPIEGGFSVVLLDGEYPDPIKTDRSFAYPVRVRAMNDYQAVLVNTGKTPIKLTGSRRAHRLFNITFSGLQIKGQGPRPQGYSLVYLWKADAVTLDNCVIHDSFRNDLMRVLNSARITVRNSIFYNPDPGEEALEINGGSQDVVVEGSIFFNDYAASGRSGSSSGPFVLVATSSSDSDGITRRITVQRNIFLQRVSDSAWLGQIHVGGDSKKDYMAQDITVQNNLFVAADGQNVGVPVRVSAARDVVIRANTVRSGPGSFQAMGDIQREKSAPICSNIQIANNVFLDGEPNRFIRGDSGAVENSSLENNVYWHAPPITTGDHLNYTDDGRRIEADPLLPPDGDRIPMPVLQGYGFAGGHVSIPGAFAAYVQRYAIPSTGSPMVNAASANMPPDDIIGSVRDGAPDVGAYEVNGRIEAPTPTPIPSDTPTSTPTDIPPPPMTTPTDTPLPPTAMPTDAPVPPTATPTNIPVPPTAMPTDTPVPPMATPTNTPVPPPTNTPVPTSTNTPVPTSTNTPVPTSTNTPVPPPTNTPVPPPTNTPVPPTATPTNPPRQPMDGAFYVSPSGNDSNPGTLDRPWRTISHAVNSSAVQPGHTIYLRGGTYAETVDVGISGAPGAPVTIRNYPDEEPVISIRSERPVWVIEDQSHIHIVGLTWRDYSRHALIFRTNNQNMTDLQVRDCHFEQQRPSASGLGGHGVYFNATSGGETITDVLVQGCSFYDIDTRVPATGNWSETLTATGHVSQVLWQNNTFERLASICMDIIGTSAGLPHHIIIRNNQIKDWGYYASGGNAIYVDGPSSYILIENNVMEAVNSGNMGITISSERSTPPEHGRYIIIRRNLVMSSTRSDANLGGGWGDRDCATNAYPQDVAFVHNTLYAPGGVRRMITWYCIDRARVKNNILAADQADGILMYADGNPYNNLSTIESDYNLFNQAGSGADNWTWNSTTYGTLAAFQATGLDAHSLTGNPAFVNPAADDFRLQSTSPAIDGGGPLAQVLNTGSGTVIPISDIRYFTNGWGLQQGDTVRIGDDVVTVVGVDYGANTLTVNRSISWSAGEPVNYDYVGSGPDLGAYEMGATG